MQRTTRDATALKILIAVACSVIIIAGLRATQVVFVPLLLAGFLALLGEAPYSWLQRRGVPGLVAAFFTGLLGSGIFLLFGTGLAASFAQFRVHFPRYQARVTELSNQAITWLEGLGLELPDPETPLFDPQAGLDFATEVAGQIFTGLSYALLVLIFVFFILLESTDLAVKLRRLANGDLARIEKVGQEVKRYLGVKSLMSSLTALGAGLVCFVGGVQLALLWVVLAFFFNFVPVIGSIVAGVAPVALALLDHGWPTATGVLAGYLLVNISVSNFLEPVLMGSRLQLSPLAVFLSLVFWGWLWGPVGMLLSVLLTRVAMIFLENTAELRWLAMLLSWGDGSGKEIQDGTDHGGS